MIVCSECQKPVYKKFAYKCPCGGEKEKPSFKKEVLSHPCAKMAKPPVQQRGTPVIQTSLVQSLREERASNTLPDSHPIVKLWEQCDFTLENMERIHILRVVDLCHGNKVQASQILGITARTLYNKLSHYGIHIPSEGVVQ